jgi:hypothetical protein
MEVTGGVRSAHCEFSHAGSRRRSLAEGVLLDAVAIRWLLYGSRMSLVDL